MPRLAPPRFARALRHGLLLLALAAPLAQAQPAGRPDEAALQSALRAAEARHGAQSVELLQPLLGLMNAQASAGRPAQALATGQRALQLAEQHLGPEHATVARLLGALGDIAREAGQTEVALGLHRRSIALHERLFGPDHPALAEAANNYGLALQVAGRLDEALPQLERSLAIRERLQPPDAMAVAQSLNSLGEYHRMAGPLTRAADYYTRSLAIIEPQMGPEHWLTGLLLSNLAATRLQLGQFDQALPAAERSLAIREKLFPAPHPQIALGLNVLAEVHRALGQDARAGQLLERTLAMFEQLFGPTHPEVAMALNNLGGWLAAQGRADEALVLYQRALAIVQQQYGPDHPNVASALNNIGTLQQETGRHQEALATLRRSLAIREQRLGEDHPLTATSVHNLALAFTASGDRTTALALEQRALTSTHDNPASRPVRAAAQLHLSQLYFAAAQPDLAIVWGKEAVNTQQALRAETQGLERALQSSYLERQRRAYDHLADLLIAQGRIAEAQDVLQMLKEAELHEDLRRAETLDPRTTRIDLTGLERSRFARYYALRDELATLAVERQTLQARARTAPLPPPDAARLRQIEGDLQPVAARAMQAFFPALEREMAGLAATGTVPAGQEASRLRPALDALAQSEPQARAVGVQYLVTAQRLSIVLSLPGSPPIARQLPVDRKDLYQRIAAVLAQMQSPYADTARLRPGLQALHQLLIAPIAEDLRRYGARTLMLSLDDQLRLVPFAALVDERQRFLVQDYSLALYNEAARLSLQRPDERRWRIAAMGLSEAVENLQPLRAVPAEIAAIVAGGSGSGDTFLNAAFDGARLRSVLRPPAAGAPGYNVLHIASHFVMQPGLPALSRLYLGDKSRLTLADISRENLPFGSFDLVTFSACETGRGGGRDVDGREMESLGAKAQNQGARAVMATLWQVADESTGAFMRDFYAASSAQRLNKAEALRAVQLAMIEGRLRRTQATEDVRGVALPQADSRVRGAPDAASWASPFHWAPFVVMGNWR